MVIDENPPTPENLSFEQRHTPSPASNNNNNFNNNELKINSFGQGFADAINICRKESSQTTDERRETQPQPQPTHTVKFEPQQQALYYPTFPDFSLPFSLSGLIQKKKAEMAAILAPRISPKEEHSKLTWIISQKLLLSRSHRCRLPKPTLPITTPRLASMKIKFRTTFGRSTASNATPSSPI